MKGVNNSIVTPIVDNSTVPSKAAASGRIPVASIKDPITNGNAPQFPQARVVPRPVVQTDRLLEGFI